VRRRRFLNPADRPPDAVSLEQLFRTLDRRLFDFLLALSTFLDPVDGRCYPGQRALGERSGTSRSTANRRIAELVAGGILRKDDPGGRSTCRYQITPQYLPAVLEARLRLRSDWFMHWRRSGKVTQQWCCAQNGTQGEADRIKPPSLKTTESLRRESSTKNDGVDAEGCADAPPAGIEAEADPASTEQSSDAGPLPAELTIVTMADPPAARFVPITRPPRRRQCQPKGPALRSRIRERSDMKRTAFLQAVGDLEALAAYQRAITGSDPDAARRQRDLVERRMRKARWKPPPGLLPEFDPFHTRRPRPTPEERQRRRDLLECKLLRFLKAKGRPGQLESFITTMLGDDEAVKQRLFDAVAEAMHAHGWDDIPPAWYQHSGLPLPGRRAPPKPLQPAAVSTPADDGRDRAAADAIMLRSGWFHGKSSTERRPAEPITIGEILRMRAAR
jgi:hypothetical protein